MLQADTIRSLLVRNEGWPRPTFSPHKPHVKQAAFLLAARDTQYREIFYGGAGGGGKSDALLMLALQDDWVSDPNYSALILRKTFVDLNQPEGILNRAQHWLDGVPGVTWHAQRSRFVFDSGAVIQFGHCNGPRDHLKYRGGKYNLVCWDELTDFPEEQYTFLFSRIRRPKGSTLPLLSVAASNPGGPGHAWVRDRLVYNTAKAQDRLFISARFTDNPHLDTDEYSRTLDNLLPVERARIKSGDWEVLDGASLFSLTWYAYLNEVPPGERITVRAWDCASTANGGDYTVGLKMHLIKNQFYIEHMVRGQWGPAELDDVMIKTAEMDGPECYVLLEREPGSAGKRANQYVRQRLSEYMVIEEAASGDKYIRATPAAKIASKGHVKLIRGGWTKDFIQEVCSFTGNEDVDSHDDIVDAYSLGTNFLMRCTDIV